MPAPIIIDQGTVLTSTPTYIGNDVLKLPKLSGTNTVISDTSSPNQVPNPTGFGISGVQIDNSDQVASNFPFVLQISLGTLPQPPGLVAYFQNTTGQIASAPITFYPASALAQLIGGIGPGISSPLIITNVGYGYTGIPTAVFTPPGATAVLMQTGGSISSAIITIPGTYIVAPTVQISTSDWSVSHTFMETYDWGGGHTSTWTTILTLADNGDGTATATFNISGSPSFYNTTFPYGPFSNPYTNTTVYNTGSGWGLSLDFFEFGSAGPVHWSISLLVPPWVYSPATLPNGIHGVMYSQGVSGSGGKSPYTWALSGSVPPGLMINSSTGAITGTPTLPGLYTFSVNLTDAGGATALYSYTITIA